MAKRTPVSIDDEIEQDRNGSVEQPGGNPQPARDIPKLAGFELHSPGDFIDGGTDYTGDSDGGSGKRRGRPRGSKNGTKTETKAPHNLADGIEKLLLSVHAMGSVFLHCPELELDPVEAKLMASSIRDLSKHYQVSLDPKKLAMVEFGTVLASVYGLRGAMIYKRLKREATAKPKLVPQPIREQPARVAVTQDETLKQPLRMPVPSDYFGAQNGVEDLSQL